MVMVRVKPSILPPTMMTAPTSAAARPKPASSAVTRLKRASQISVAMRAERADVHGGKLVAIFDPQVLDGLARQRRDDRRDQHGLRDDHRLRREQEAPRPERPRARQQQIDRKPDDHRRQSHQRIENDDDGLAAGKAGERDERRRTARRSAPRATTADRLTISDSRTIAMQRGVAGEDEMKRGDVSGMRIACADVAFCVRNGQFCGADAAICAWHIHMHELLTTDEAADLSAALRAQAL